MRRHTFVELLSSLCTPEHLMRMHATRGLSEQEYKLTVARRILSSTERALIKCAADDVHYKHRLQAEKQEILEYCEHCVVGRCTTPLGGASTSSGELATGEKFF